MNRFENIAILIPTVNETTLVDVVSATVTQIPESQIYILGFGDSGKIAERYHVNFFDLGEKTIKSIALNRAIQTIDKERFIILDADAIPQPDWADNMLQGFEEGHQIFSGSVDISKGNIWMRVYNISMLHEFHTLKPPGFRKHLPAINLGFTRDFYNQNGPFLDKIVRSEDYEWTLRAVNNNMKLYFKPNAIVQHIPVKKDNFRSMIKFWIDSGYDSWLVREKYKDILQTPFFMHWPWFILLASPILGLFPTLRIISTSKLLFINYIYLIPLIYLTKVAWCWGIFIDSYKKNAIRSI